MNAKASQIYLGKRAAYAVNGLVFSVIIDDVKQAYGATRFLIKPVSGGGQTWVDRGSLKMIELSVDQEWVASQEA